MAIVNVLTPSVVVANHMGDGTIASFIITIYTIGSMVMGFLFCAIFKAFKRYISRFALYGMGKLINE
ncbi:hypothetical protein [Fructobacillus fructosus]|uniref:hypothetical protein n=1 Tax=Fructobacillus fructosus TaxID=1631 RepID=UPI00200ADACF|nr:hypothetical protein [Fructobacillus fructosus]MCK8638046.1 hypothetical protein [Fructobacillus fructosus]